MNIANIVKYSLLAAALVIIACLAGCRGKNPDAAKPAAPAAGAAAILGERITRSADAAVAQPTRPYFATGLGLFVLGGLAAIVGARTMGLAAMALGGAVSALGVVIVQYPWAILLAFFLAVAAAGAALFSRWRKDRELERNRDALSAAAQVIQNLPEGQAIKQGLAALGGEVEARVRAVVTPIKEKLRLEGKITA